MQQLNLCWDKEVYESLIKIFFGPTDPTQQLRLLH